MRLAFDGFEIDTDSGQLSCAGRPVPLERRAFEMLCYLAAHPGRLITKDELLSEVWHAQTLSDGALSNAAAKLRSALGQAAGAREPIETVRGRGYRWHAIQVLLTQGPARVDHPGPDFTPAATQTAQPRADPFVGRVSVLEVLERALDQTVQGQAQLVMLAGDVGIGKTRTLEELVQRARTRGVSVWEGACYDGAGAPAYWPWIEILRAAHADLSRAIFRRHLPADGWAISLLLPELTGVEPAAANVDAQAARFRLFDEIARFIASTSGDAPRLIVLDDAHWADDGTLELLAHLIRTLKRRPVMLAVALREHAPRQDAQTAALQRLRRQATHVSLSGLSPEEVAELVLALEGPVSTDAQLTHTLHQRTQGNPFFIRQFLALLAQRGQALSGENLALPAAVRDVLLQRVDALGTHERSVLQMAAAVGTEFDAGLLADSLGLRLASVLAALELPLRSGMLVSQATPHHFAFAHALLRDAIYDELGLVQRGELHARLGRVLEQRPAGGGSRTLGEVARHSLLAVPPDLEACVRHCRNAANAARNALGVETATELLSRAIDKLVSEGGDQRVCCELLFELGLDRHHGGNLRGAWRALTEAAEIAAQIGAVELLGRCACRAASWLEVGGSEEAARRLIAQALEMIGDRDPDLRATLLARRADLCLELPASERAALLAEAEALAARRGTPQVLLEVAVCRVNQRDPARIEDTRRAVANYRAIARQHAGVLTAPQRTNYHFAAEFSDYVIALSACDLDAADAVIERCCGLADASQVITVRRGTEAMQAGRALGDGRLDDLKDILSRMSQGPATGHVFALIQQYYTARLLEARGALAALPGLADGLLKGLNDDMRPYQVANGALMLARVSAKLGAHDQARRLLARVSGEYLARLPVHFGDLGVLCVLAETHESLGDRAGALTLYPQLLPYATLNAMGPMTDYVGSVEHYLGILAELLGHTAEAVQHFERAEHINRKLRMPLQHAASAARLSSLLSPG